MNKSEWKNTRDKSLNKRDRDYSENTHPNYSAFCPRWVLPTSVCHHIRFIFEVISIEARGWLELPLWFIPWLLVYKNGAPIILATRFIRFSSSVSSTRSTSLSGGVLS